MSLVRSLLLFILVAFVCGGTFNSTAFQKGFRQYSKLLVRAVAR